ncbi:MAG: tetratricopeptide repeat protein [Acidobacteriota bacterium]
MGTSGALPSPVEVRSNVAPTKSARLARSENGRDSKSRSRNGVNGERPEAHSALLTLNGTNDDADDSDGADVIDRSSKNLTNGRVNGRQPRASALAQASGLEGASAFSSRIRTVLVLLAALIVGVASLVYYRQSLRSLRVDRPERNLVTPEEQSLDLIRLGKQSYEFGQYEKAITQFKDALALTPQHLPIHILLAQSYQASGQLDEALRAYWTLLRQEPRNLEARLEVAEVHRARGNWRDAYQEYQRIIDINSQSLEAIAALAVIEAHDQRPYGLDRSDLPKHRTLSRHGMSTLAPSLPSTGLTARLAPSTLQGNSLAAPPPNLLTGAQEDERGDVRAMGEAHKTLGIRYYNIHEFVAAIQEFSIARRLTPGDKDLYYLLGSCYDGLDQDVLANELYKQCDSGPYVQMARAGILRTAKAAKGENKKQRSVIGEVDPLPSSLPGRAPTHGLK